MTGSIFLRCEELVLNFHKCEESVPALHTCEELVHNFHKCEKSVPNAHRCEKSNQSFADVNSFTNIDIEKFVTPHGGHIFKTVK